MSFRSFCRAGLLGLGLAMAATPAVFAETLHVEGGAPSSSLNVTMNRAVVVQSDTPFSELSVANPGIADISTLSDKSIYVLGKAPGRTTLTLLAPDGKLITNVEVHVTPDVAELKERLKEILPSENIDVRTANDGIVLSGTVTSSLKLDRALELAQRYAPNRVSNLMSVGGTQQVMLQVRFAEMQRSVEKNLSSSLGVQSSAGHYNILGATGSLLSGTTNSSDQGSFSLGFSAGGLQLSVLLEALESKGAVRTLAEPNLTALSGQQASFLAGGEYPIPVQDGNNNVTVQYKPFGVGLKFTPTVVDGNQINLQINAEVSGIDSSISYTNNGFTVNAFKTRKTATTVEMRDGQSFAIAGLLQDNFNDTIGQVPWLGNIPVLGALFRSADFQRQQSELVIIITPHLVTPSNSDTLAMPTDRIRPPSEKDFFLFGHDVAKVPKGGPSEVAKQDFSGSYGYVMN